MNLKRSLIKADQPNCRFSVFLIRLGKIRTENQQFRRCEFSVGNIALYSKILLVDEIHNKEEIVMGKRKMLQELLDKRELEKRTGKIRGKRPVDIIRKMNPGKSIPTGDELAAMLREME